MRLSTCSIILLSTNAWTQVAYPVEGETEPICGQDEYLVPPPPAAGCFQIPDPIERQKCLEDESRRLTQCVNHCFDQGCWRSHDPNACNACIRDCEENGVPTPSELACAVECKDEISSLIDRINAATQFTVCGLKCKFTGNGVTIRNNNGFTCRIKTDLKGCTVVACWQF